LGNGCDPQAGDPPSELGVIQIWKKPRWLLFQIVFGVPDTGAGAHDLDVSRFGSAFVTETVPVRHCARTDIGDDLHVGVRVRWKACVGRDLVIIPDA
jgi:hypothetical protein